jgi:hypothetical protein
MFDEDPIRRRELWTVHDEAVETVEDTATAWRVNDTAATRSAVEIATRRYIESLRPLIGIEPAFRYEVSWQAVCESTDRLTRLQAALANQNAVDVSDAELLARLKADQELAVKTFTDAERSVLAAVAAAHALDSGGGK